MQQLRADPRISKGGGGGGSGGIFFKKDEGGGGGGDPTTCRVGALQHEVSGQKEGFSNFQVNHYPKCHEMPMCLVLLFIVSCES